MIQAGICDDEPGAASMIASSFSNMLRTRGEAVQTAEYHSAQQLLFALLTYCCWILICPI